MHRPLAIAFALVAVQSVLLSQSASGTIVGKVLDDQGKSLPGAVLVIANKVSGFRLVVKADAQGRYRMNNLPFSPYHLEAQAAGLGMVQRNIEVRSNLPLHLDLVIPTASAVVEVDGSAKLIEDYASSHLDIDQSTINLIPAAVQSRGLENILLATPGFIQDENGRFHFRGSHGQVMYVVDGVPVTDQVQATFSNSMDPSQVESMEVITGGISAEFGGKPVAVVNMTSKSGLGMTGGPEGDVYFGASRFNTSETGFSVRDGGDHSGYFVTGAASQSDRFLDPVNFENLHNHGTTGRLFGRFDWILSESDTLRLSLSGGQTRRDVVNLESQQAAGQNQRVENLDENLSVGWTHLFSASQSLDTSLFYRHSTSKLLPTLDLEPGFSEGGPDYPYWAKQDRTLDNQGFVTAYTQKDGGNTFKTGLQYVRYPIHENFSFAITDSGQVAGPSDPLYPYTPAGGGDIFHMDESITPRLASAFAQDDWSSGPWHLSLGLRFDSYQGRNFTEHEFQPRMGVAYTIPASNTLFRAVYDRLMVTPENEGLALSTSQRVWTLTSGLDTPVAQLRPELQDSYLLGIEQQIGKIAKISLDYWWKNSVNAADNSQFLNTGILFPIAAARGKYHGTDLRIDLVPVDGFSGYLSAGTVRTLFFDPTVGGLDAVATAHDNLPYLIDHDQKLTMQLGVRYEVNGLYSQIIGRYDSGLVAGDPTTVAGNPDYDFGIPYVHPEHDSLTGDYYRIKPHTVWNVSLGREFKLSGKQKYQLSVDLLNAFNEKGLYNFLSTFGGTHVLPPRTVAARAKYSF